MNAANDNSDPRGIRPATRAFVNAVVMDVWPSPATVVDFGLRTQEHYEALYYPLRNGDITPEQLDAALGSGPKLTALAAAAASNPHKGIVFATDWDSIPPEPPAEPDGPEMEL